MSQEHTHEGYTCDNEAQAGMGNDAGHALLHMLDATAAMSVSQSFRTATTSVAAAVLVTFFFTGNWWFFVILALVAVVDIYFHHMVVKYTAEVSDWLNVTLNITKNLHAESTVKAALLKYHTEHGKGEDS